MPTNFSPFFERMNGIEPSSPAWKAGARTVVLHPRIGKVAAPIGCYVRGYRRGLGSRALLLPCHFEPPVGFEPTTCSLQVNCTTAVLRGHKMTAPACRHDRLTHSCYLKRLPNGAGLDSLWSRSILPKFFICQSRSFFFSAA